MCIIINYINFFLLWQDYESTDFGVVTIKWEMRVPMPDRANMPETEIWTSANKS